MSPDKQGSPTSPRAAAGEVETFRHILSRLRGLIPLALLDDSAWDRLLDRTGDLPINAARFFGFEFRLGDPVPAADLIVRVPPRSPLAEHYIRQGEAAEPSSAAASLGRYLTELQVGRSGRLFDLALEYDIAEVPHGHYPPPGVFLKLPSAAAAKGVVPPDTMTAALAAAVGWTGDAGERRVVERVFYALPPGGRVCFLGALPGREVRAIRVMVEDIEESNVPAFLQRLDWPGPANAVAALFSDLRDVVSLHDFQIAIDVTARGVLPHIGLEMKCPFIDPGGRGAWTKTTRRDWLPFVTRLEERGWCRPEKAHGLLSYLGKEIFVDGMGNIYLAYKGINHIKLSIRDDDVSAKAYAGLSLSRYQS